VEDDRESDVPTNPKAEAASKSSIDRHVAGCNSLPANPKPRQTHTHRERMDEQVLEKKAKGEGNKASKGGQ